MQPGLRMARTARPPGLRTTLSGAQAMQREASRFSLGQSSAAAGASSCPATHPSAGRAALLSRPKTLACVLCLTARHGTSVHQRHLWSHWRSRARLRFFGASGPPVEGAPARSRTRRTGGLFLQEAVAACEPLLARPSAVQGAAYFLRPAQLRRLRGPTGARRLRWILTSRPHRRRRTIITITPIITHIPNDHRARGVQPERTAWRLKSKSRR